MGKDSNFRFRCGCGRFVSWDADSSVSFGGYEDLEPPEPEYYCPECIRKLKSYYKRTDSMPMHWQPAAWEEELAEELGFEWVAKEGCSWSCWKKREAA